MKILPKIKSYKLNRGMTRSILQAFGSLGTEDSGRTSESQARRGHPEYCRGMTYAELIVVLSIFSVMSAITMFSYGDFQTKVDMKNLANDIALKVVQAQKESLGGKWTAGATSLTWKPSYGVDFNIGVNNKRFVYFTDLNNNKRFQNNICWEECLENIAITKGNYISGLTVVGTGNCSGVTRVSVVFTRPDSGAVIDTYQPGCNFISSAEITVSSPSGSTSKIKLYSSGRVQIN